MWATGAGWHGCFLLDGRPVTGIDEMLYPQSRSGWRKQRLAVNAGKSFIGSVVVGPGFMMSPEEALALIDKNLRNADVLMPYLAGEDLNQSPTQTALRWIINFRGWSQERAEQYPDCLTIVEYKVKAERAKAKDRAGRFWWRYMRPCLELYRTIQPLDRVLAITLHSNSVQPCFVPSGQVFSHGMCVFAYDDDFHFGVLASGFHYRWGLRHASSLGLGARYTPTDVFETFPQPRHSEAVEMAGKSLDEHRSKLMTGRGLGLTSVYNLVHDPSLRSDEGIKRLRDLHIDLDEDIQPLRDLHVELDLAVRDAYGWSDLDLGHGFHDVRGQGVRFTFSPSAADEVLGRLLELNRKRYEAEVAAGLHERAKKPKKARSRVTAGQGSLLGGER